MNVIEPMVVVAFRLDLTPHPTHVQWWAVLNRFNKSLFPTLCVDTHIYLDVIKAGCSEILSDPYVSKQAKIQFCFEPFDRGDIP